jgi:hypothetical protein
MDLTRILEQLYAERDRVGQVIATLEQFQQENNTPVPAPAPVVGSGWAQRNAMQWRAHEGLLGEETSAGHETVQRESETSPD